MKVLVNASTLVAGGGIQVGATFIQYISRSDTAEEYEFIFAVSPLVYEDLPRELQEDSRVRLILSSPSRIVRGHKSRRALKDIEKEFAPDLIYSIGSPSYTCFRHPEIARFTNPWVTHATELAWTTQPAWRRIYVKGLAAYNVMWLRRCAYFETQSEAARDGLMRLVPRSRGHIRVIPNTYSPVFSGALAGQRRFAENGVCRVLILAAPHPQKNLTIVPRIASLLEANGGMQYRFIVTVPGLGRVAKRFWRAAKNLNVESQIENVGRVTLSQCPALYCSADIVLLPTLLETFSVTYLEAMTMGKPIVTTDLDFAHDTCGDAAVYYDPLSPKAAAEAIERIVREPDLRARLKANGERRLGEFPDPEKKYALVIEWIKQVGRGTSMR